MTATNQRTFLVTGAMGCVGVWTIYHLLQRGEQVVSFDVSDDRHRLNLLLADKEQEAITFVQGDLSDFSHVIEAFQAHNITHVIHLAALQVPFCKADPIKGAQVNVVGTVNVFEAARQMGMSHITYATSIAVYGPPELYPDELIPNDAPFAPKTLYGVYKVANEGTANVYWNDHQISSIALRPYTIYGPARDQGMTSDPTKAMLAAAADRPFHIAFGGAVQFHYASDVALQFIEAALHKEDGAYGYNLGTKPAMIEDIVAMIQSVKPDAQITYDELSLPFPDCDDREYRRQPFYVKEVPLKEGVRKTIEHFESCLNDGRIQVNDR
jgi:nucleoside-diphosphate-sugar epimerase